MPLEMAMAFYVRTVTKEPKVLDLIFVGLTIVFFLIALAYVRASEKLR